MATLAEILKDTRTYPDDFKFKLAEGVEITIGDLRQQEKATRDELVKALEAEKERLRADREVLERAQSAFAQRYGAALDTEAASPVKTNAGEDPFEVLASDPLFAPIVKRIQQLETERLAKLAENVEQLAKALQVSAQTYVLDLLDRRWEPIAEEATKAGYTKEKLLRHAHENRLTDHLGMPDIREAYNRLTAPQRAEAERKKIREEVERELLSEHKTPAANLFIRPTSVPPGGGKRFVPKNPERALEEAIEAAMSDSDLWREATTQ